MGFFDSAQGVIDKGVSGGERRCFGRCRGTAVLHEGLCAPVRRRLGPRLARAQRREPHLSHDRGGSGGLPPFFYENPSNWIPLGVQADNLRGAFFAATGAGCYLRNVALDIARNVGIVEISASAMPVV